MVITQGFDSCNPSSNLGWTFLREPRFPEPLLIKDFATLLKKVFFAPLFLKVDCRFGLEVWFSFWVREAAGSIPASDLLREPRFPEPLLIHNVVQNTIQEIFYLLPGK